MDAQSIVKSLKEYVDNKIASSCKAKGVVTSISGGIYVRASWNNKAWEVPIKKYKHVSVNVGDIVDMEYRNGTYIIVGVIE